MKTPLPILLILLLAGAAFSQAPPAPQFAPHELPPDPFDELVRAIVLDVLPAEYVDDDDWGKTKSFVTGLKLSRDGLRIKTKRRRKELRHGSWEWYRARLLDPERFELRVDNLRSVEGGKVAFDLSIVAPLDVEARVAEWARGVQLFNFSVGADATLKLSLSCTAGVSLDATKLPPDVVLKPHVTAAELRLVDFRLRQISKLRGSIAAKLGRSVRGRLARKVAQKDAKIVEKINSKIAKSEDKLRLSASALVKSELRDLMKVLK